MTDGLDPGRVLACVARVSGLPAAALVRQHRPLGRKPNPSTAARIAAAWLLRHRCRLTYREIAQRLRMHRVSAGELVGAAARRPEARALVQAAEVALERSTVDVDAELRRARLDAARAFPARS